MIMMVWQMKRSRAAPDGGSRRPSAKLPRLSFRIQVLALTLALFLTACAAPRVPSGGDDREILSEFRQELIQDADKVGDYLEQTRRGHNLSEMTLGWFICDLLTELSSQDEPLYRHFNKNGGGSQGYLRSVFPRAPAEAVAELDILAKQGNPTRRLAARYALEALRHIPDDATSAASQAEDRRALAAALATLQKLLTKSAAEIVLPPL